MKKFVALCLLLAMSVPVGAVEGNEVMYAGSTVPNVQNGAIGRLDTTSLAAITFEYSGNKLVIPYAKIASFEYSQEVARHLGVLPAIAVVLVKKRQRKHFFRISFQDDSGTTEVAVFEVSTRTPKTLLPILQSRSPQACHQPKSPACGESWSLNH
jgi:hypothetical protein